MKRIGIIGAGAIGATVARVLARANIGVDIANSRGPASLASMVHQIGPHARAVERAEAAAAGIVLVAVNWSKLPVALAGLPDWGGRLCIDANNPIEAPDFQPADLDGRSSSYVFSQLVPGARVVKAFNHLPPPLLGADPRSEGGRRVLFYSGDEIGARREVGDLIERLGFFGVDLGTLAVGGLLAQFPGGPLPGLNLVKFG